MNILETKGLSHHFKSSQVLFDVELRVRQGEHHAIIGPQRRRKTTLFNVITCTYQPTNGRRSFSRARTSHRTGLLPIGWRARVWGALYRSPTPSRSRPFSEHPHGRDVSAWHQVRLLAPGGEVWPA